MYKKFVYVDYYEEIKDIGCYFTLYQFLSSEKVKKRLIKKFPYKVEDKNILDEMGFLVRLPIITSINQLEDENYIKKIIEKFNSIALLYNVNVVILCKELKNYSFYFNTMVAKDRFLGIIFINEILEKINKMVNITEKNIKYIIIDGKNTLASYIIDNIGQNINSMTLITDNRTKYEKKIEEIYENTGLAVQVYNKHITSEIDGDIIINCCDENDKLYYWWKKRALLIDFISDETKIRDIISKRKDLNLIYDFNVKIEDSIFSNDWILGLLLNKNRLLRNIYVYGYKNEMKKRIPLIKETYGYNMTFELLRA